MGNSGVTQAKPSRRGPCSEREDAGFLLIRKRSVNNRKGFSLIESLLSLVFFLIIILSSLEFFGTTKKIFFRLKEAQESGASAAAALEKIRIDLLHTGRGLAQPISLGLFGGIELQDEALSLIIGEKVYTLASDLPSGQSAVPLSDTEGLVAEKEVCIFDGQRGEVLRIDSVDKSMMRSASPPANSYLRQDGKIVLLQKVSFYLERESSVLRRKVNTSPAQPLVEGVRFFGVSYDGRSNLAQVQIGLEKEPEKIHEISVFLKNMALGKIHEM
jgi:type II secretory pathway pseudopilin PulG